MKIEETDYIEHYGIIRRSGRYPWGSGGDPSSFLGMVKNYKDDGKTQKEISDALGITTKELRARISIANAEKKMEEVSLAQRLKDKNWSNAAIAERMGLPGESSVRALLAPRALDRANRLHATVNVLTKELQKNDLIDVGEGVNNHMGLTREQLDTAITYMEIHKMAQLHSFPQARVFGHTNIPMRVLAKHDMTKEEVFSRRNEVGSVKDVSSDGGLTFDDFKTPISVSSKRLKVRYAEEGGTDADGVVYIRPGVKDLSMGKNSYSQVRIMVDKTHYIKGMGIYKDDLPDGVDLVFNTNKSNTGNKLDALKPLNEDPDLPFGSIVRQILDKPGHPDAKPTSAINVVSDEEQWSKWSKSLSSQMLSKQHPDLINRQLKLTRDKRQVEFDEIMALTNPVVKRKMLQEFADDVDSASVHLKAERLPRSSWHVILPVSSLKDNEVYAPNYKDGEWVSLIRYPHAGTFEIPLVKVNNKNKEAKNLIGNEAKTAVGINSRVAERLSGADFDGDTVLVIPNKGGKLDIKSSAPLEGLKNFTPNKAYPGYEGMPVMTDKQLGKEMGSISNLITDMTLKGASRDELTRAVRHSMVVIDAKKHKLNYKLSAVENGIPALKEKYQGGKNKGAATLISRAKGAVRIPERKPRPYAQGGPIDSKTGAKVYVDTGRTRKDKEGNEYVVNQKLKRLAVTDNAHDLSSKTIVENLYADHSNALKDLANRARKESLVVPKMKRDPAKAAEYADEVTRLNAALEIYDRNKPLERQANNLATAMYAAKVKANPNMEKKEKDKLRQRSLMSARRKIGVQRIVIDVTPRQWEAIQAGAISQSKLEKILKRADPEQIKEYATPKSKLLMTDTKINKAKAMLNGGYTRAEVAAALGVSLSTLDRGLG